MGISLKKLGVIRLGCSLAGLIWKTEQSVPKVTLRLVNVVAPLMGL